jgi:hypothetical protein
MDSNEFIRENNIKFSTDSDDREGKKWKVLDGF